APGQPLSCLYCMYPTPSDEGFDGRGISLRFFHIREMGALREQRQLCLRDERGHIAVDIDTAIAVVETDDHERRDTHERQALPQRGAAARLVGECTLHLARVDQAALLPQLPIEPRGIPIVEEEAVHGLAVHRLPD